ncbi:MAG: tRNA pseudouridine(55) synthase TruB [Gammaproteobacteria bacterium]|nr:tRNA pseudouridine(55) synthase TruB [Gammaproteobacteria bacterium]
MGRRRDSSLRDVHGILLLDKPVGITSNSALQKIKRLFKARKAGHTGSLDPLASGLLVVCLGEATKISAYLLDADKRYIVSARVGAKTDTGDAAGKIIRDNVAAPTNDALVAALEGFRGDINQVPPMYSALKHQGQRLYELARKGLEVERKARKVTIRQLDLIGFDDGCFSLDVVCSKGTYIRTLVEDIAEAAGSCAHVVALRREVVGPFSGDNMLSIDHLERLAEQGPETLDSVLLPIDSAITGWPAVTLSQDAAWYLQRGQPVTVPRVPDQGWVRLYQVESDFIGIGEVTADGQIAPRRIFRL